MATVQLTVCDVCADRERPAKHFGIESEERGLTSLDLCDEHAEPLMALLEVMPPAASEGRKLGNTRTPRGGASKTPRRSRGAEVVTLEQIEEMKRNNS